MTNTTALSKKENIKKELEKQVWFKKKLSGKTSAIILIIVFCLSLLYIFSLSKYLNSGFKPPVLLSGIPVTSVSKNFFLEINNPDDNIFTTDKNILISGSTLPNAVVIISTLTNDYGFEASDKGEFSKIIPLASGLNYIKVNAFDSDGTQKTAERTVFYSPEEL